MAKVARLNLKDGIILAKSKWSNQLAERIYDQSASPRDSWKAVNTLRELIQGHHKSPDIIRFKNEDGSFIETDENNVKYLSGHFHNLFNSDVQIKWTALEEF